MKGFPFLQHTYIPYMCIIIKKMKYLHKLPTLLLLSVEFSFWLLFNYLHFLFPLSRLLLPCIFLPLAHELVNNFIIACDTVQHHPQPQKPHHHPHHSTISLLDKQI